MYNNKTLSINIKGQLKDFSRPWVMGIINVTPDSFFDGSRTFDSASVAARVRLLMEQGADCLDIGGYSSRSGADEVSEEEEYDRLARALEVVRRDWPEAVVSVDTFRSGVARRCVEEWGVDIVNDISGGDMDSEMWPVVAELGCAYVLMHMRGEPKTMQSLTDYSDLMADVISALAFRLDSLRSLGVADVIIDPGFGFAKTVEQNLRMLDSLGEFRRLGCPVLAGLSRKTMIWKTLGITPAESLNGTVVADTVALMRGADILRVHDVREAVQTVTLIQAMRQASH